MTATLASSLPSTASVVLAPSTVADAEIKDTTTSSFSGLLQKILGKVPEESPIPEELLASFEVAVADTTLDNPAEELNALLPFLEAIGFLPKETVQSDVSATESLTLSLENLTAVVPLNPSQVIQPAIPAGESEEPMSSLISVPSYPTLEKPTVTSDLQTTLVTNNPTPKGQIAETGPIFQNEITPTVNSLVSATTPASHTHAVAVTEPVGSPQWGSEVGQRIVWIANRSAGQAELVLTPPNMGRVEVNLTVTGDQATASFVSANPTVREALEAALPRLREVLAEAGIQLGQAQVGAENTRQSTQQDNRPEHYAARDNTLATGSPAQNTEDRNSGAITLKLGRGLVDVFA